MKFDYDEFRNIVEGNEEPRFYVVNIPFKTKYNQEQSKVVMLNWVPVKVSPRLKMRYSSAKQLFIGTLCLGVCIDAREHEDLDLKGVLAHFS